MSWLVTKLVRAAAGSWVGPALVSLLVLALTGTVTWHVLKQRAERMKQVEAAYNAGARAERVVWAKAREAERERQRTENAKAIAAAQADVERITAEKQTLIELLNQSGNEARDDPSANRPALSPDSVLRLNRIR